MRRLFRAGYFILIVAFLCASPAPQLHSQSSNYLNETVMFNVQTHKYHKPSCPWAIRCTRNCIPIKRGDAIRRGGVACKVCGG